MGSSLTTQQRLAFPLKRDRLLERIGQEPLTVLAAPDGWGKWTLINQYIERLKATSTRQIILYTYNIADSNLQTFARNLTVAIGNKLEFHELFSTPASEYFSGRDYTTAAQQASLIAADLNNSQLPPCTLILRGLNNNSAAAMIYELAARMTGDADIQIIVTGPESILDTFDPAITTVLGRDDLQFTEAELQQLGITKACAEAEQNWPAGIGLLAQKSGQADGNHERYARILARRIPASLLPAALLPEWSETKRIAERQALKLPRSYLNELMSYGVPMWLDEDHNYRVQPAVGHAMLSLLEESHTEEALATLKEGLAKAWDETDPLRAMSLRSSSADTAEDLFRTRPKLPEWIARGQWSLIIEWLTHSFMHLTPDEIALLARAHCERSEQIRDQEIALKLAVRARELGAQEPDVTLTEAEILWRMGSLSASIRFYDQALRMMLKSGTREAQLHLIGWLALAYAQAQNPHMAQITLAGAENEYNLQSTIHVARAAALCAVGDIQKARNAAAAAKLLYHFHRTHSIPDSELRPFFNLCFLLIDMGDYQSVDELKTALPKTTQNLYSQINAVYLAGMEAFRKRNCAQSEKLLNEALEKAKQAKYKDIVNQILISKHLLAIYQHHYFDAGHILEDLRRTNSGQDYLDEVITELELINNLCAGRATPTSRPYSNREAGLVVALASGKGIPTHHDQAEPRYPQGIIDLWQNWYPLGQELNLSPPGDDFKYDPPAYTQEKQDVLRIRVCGEMSVELNGDTVRMQLGMWPLFVALADMQLHTRDDLAAIYPNKADPRGYVSTMASTARREINRDRNRYREILDTRPGEYQFVGVTVELDLHVLATLPPEQIPQTFPNGGLHRSVVLQPTLAWIMDQYMNVLENIAQRLLTHPDPRTVMRQLIQWDDRFLECPTTARVLKIRKG